LPAADGARWGAPDVELELEGDGDGDVAGAALATAGDADGLGWLDGLATTPLVAVGTAAAALVGVGGVLPPQAASRPLPMAPSARTAGFTLKKERRVNCIRPPA
jgi:hypothetical protein